MVVTKFYSATLIAEIWEYGSITTMKLNKATDTSNQMIIQFVNKPAAYSDYLNHLFGWKTKSVHR